jgi:polyphosphate kinase
LSVGAVFLLWGKSRSEDMKMSYSNELLLEREKFLEGYSATLDEFQTMRRKRLSQNKSFNQGNQF